MDIEMEQARTDSRTQHKIELLIPHSNRMFLPTSTM